MCFFPRELGAPAVSPGPAIEWEETRCLLCGGGNWAHLVEASDNAAGGTGLWFAVVQCQQCGLCFTNPRPTAASIARFYPPHYQPHRTRTRTRTRTRHRLHDHARWDWFRRRHERQVLPVHGAGRLLDFGCGGGSYLERMHAQGWNVTGLDTSAAAVERIRADLGLHALVGSLPHLQLAPGSFDMITMWHALEHVHEPLQVLRHARGLLAPGGRILVAVPNIDSLPFRWFGNAWFGLDLPRHLTHFTSWTLTQMLQLAGFRVRPVRMLRHSDWLRSSAQLACRSPRRPYWHRWLTHKPASRLAAWYSYLTYQSDCILALGENA